MSSRDKEVGIKKLAKCRQEKKFTKTKKERENTKRRTRANEKGKMLLIAYNFSSVCLECCVSVYVCVCDCLSMCLFVAQVFTQRRTHRWASPMRL